ncbi:MAG: hypothetical protein VKM97_06655 [Cyanobacteriota bacterium]|nr:hypothetical protein [Cyanobacteriota bacterium]
MEQPRQRATGPGGSRGRHRRPDPGDRTGAGHC